MKTSTARLALGAALVLGTAAPALAEQPAKDWMPLDLVFQSVARAGYADVREIEADDGHWQGKATRDGHPVAFHADARTGAVTRETPVEPRD